MHRLNRIVAIAAAAACAACGSPQTTTLPTPESTPESTPAVIIESTAEVTGDLRWQTYVQAPPTDPGWTFDHLDGWQIVDAVGGQTVFLYSAPELGEQLFASGLPPGQFVFQFSLNIAPDSQQPAAAHLTSLTAQLPDAVLSEPQPITLDGIEWMQQTGRIDPLALDVRALSRRVGASWFIDILAYSRADEAAAQAPVVDAVIRSARYLFPTE